MVYYQVIANINKAGWSNLTGAMKCVVRCNKCNVYTVGQVFHTDKVQLQWYINRLSQTSLQPGYSDLTGAYGLRPDAQRLQCALS